MDVCEILKFVAENPRIPFYRFIFLYHENMEFRVFCGFFNEIFKKFQILFFPYMKLQLLINNVFIIFDNCAFKIQNSKKKLVFWTVSYTIVLYYILQERVIKKTVDSTSIASG